MNAHLAAASNRRGSALFAALAAVAVLASFGVGLVQLQAALSRRQATYADRRSALYLAEAGIAEATLAVSQGRSGAVATEDVPALFGRGVYWVEAEDLPGGRKLLTAHAAVASGRFSLQTVVMPNVSPVGNYGFFGDELVWIGWGSILDGYDSREGSFASQLDPAQPYETTGRGVDVFSNGDIVVEGAPADEGGSTSTEDLTYELAATTQSNLVLLAGDLAEMGNRETAAQAADLAAEILSRQDELLDLDPEVVANAETYLEPLVGEGQTLIALYGGDGSGGLAVSGTQDGGGTTPPAEPTSDPTVGGTCVHGTVTPGADGYVRTTGDAYVETLATVDEDALGMPAFVVPSDVVDLGTAETVAPGETLVYEAADVRLDGVVVQPNGTLVLRGPVTVVADTLDVAPAGSVVFDDGPGPVRLYVADRLAFERGSLVSSPAPHETAFGTYVFAGSGTTVAPGSRVRFAPSGEFHGVLYAPEDDLVLPASVRYFGAAGAKRLFVEGGARASYDGAFANGGTSVPVLPKILSWQIVPTEDGRLRSLRFDPVAQYRLLGVDPVPSAVAARDTQASIQYLDGAGMLQSYDGDVAAFDWSNVSRVTALRWTSQTTGAPLEWTLPAGFDPDHALMIHRDDLRWELYRSEYVNRRTVRDASGEQKYRGVLTDATCTLMTSTKEELEAATADGGLVALNALQFSDVEVRDGVATTTR